MPGQQTVEAQSGEHHDGEDHGVDEERLLPPGDTATAPMMTAVGALHGMSVARVEAMTRSRRDASERVAMMAGTLQPPAAMSGTTARPCRPKRCMTRSLRKAAAFM